MKRVSTFPFFCSHNSFDVYDASFDPFTLPIEPRSHEMDRKLQVGCFRREEMICYRTVGGANLHRFDVFTSPSAPKLGKAERLLAHNLALKSGEMAIFGLDVGKTVQLGRGNYVLYCRAFHLGKEILDRLPEVEFLAREDLERYELILVPGQIKKEGVIVGPETLEPFQKRYASEWNRVALRNKLRNLDTE